MDNHGNDQANKDAHAKPKAHKSHAHVHSGSHEEHEGAPEWLISFADNVMLMMGIFVILLALNMNKPEGASAGGPSDGSERAGAGESDQELDFALAVRKAFNNEVDINSLDPADALLVRRLRERTLGTPRGNEGTSQGPPELRPLGPQDVAWDGGIVTFAEFATELDPAARQTLIDLTPQLEGVNFTVELRGHASIWESMNHPERGYDIAHKRARAAALFLVEQGIPWERIRIVSMGDSAGRSKEQVTPRGVGNIERVEIVLVR